MEVAYIIIMGLSVLSSILAWIAKIRWSNEYKIAKEAQIELLKETVETYKDLTPMKIREYFHSVKTQLIEQNNELQNQLHEASSVYSAKEDELQKLYSQSIQDNEAINKLTDEKKELVLFIEEINNEAIELKTQLGDFDSTEKIADKLIDDHLAKKARKGFLKNLKQPLNSSIKKFI